MDFRRLPRAAAACATLALVLFAVRPATAGVILSELCDPLFNYTTDRYIEIYNAGPAPVDLTGWKVIAVANSADANTWTLSGTIAVGEAKVCGSTAPVTSFPIHYASAPWLTNYFNWNGRVGDGAKLVNASNVVLDYVLAPGALFENLTLVRNVGITEPSASFDAGQWTGTAVNTSPDATPGSHHGSTPTPGGPRITNVAHDPASPAAGVPVDVQAAVVDTTGEVQAVTLAWGTSAGNLPNVIGMPLLADSTYRTSSPIPGQSSGITIYYRVDATGAVESASSSVRNYTIPGGGTGVAPTVLAVGQQSDSTLLVTFSETVEETSAETASNYSIGALVATWAVRDPTRPAEVEIRVNGVAPGTRTLTVSGVADLEANIASGATRSFPYIDTAVPAGYYDAMAGLVGSALRKALHIRIRNHTVGSYSGALTSFQTTDRKPNGKVWDMYSDVPGGVLPYEYSFGQTGQGATEGLGYNREHSFPASWFNDASPTYSDLWVLYPTDAKVNGYRSNYPYGEVDSPTTTSLNGSRLGPSVSPGYASTVFEPIDAYKGDLARGQFYVATRYFGQDGAWPGSGAADGAEYYPWAVAQYRAWSTADPPSWKERLRNGAVYAIQGNRNPFVDHPEYLTLIFDSTSVVGVEPVAAGPAVALRANVPNPFAARTTVFFDLAQPAAVSIVVYDVTGRRVRTLVDGGAIRAAGTNAAEWDARDDGGMRVAPGLYFVRLELRGAEGVPAATRRMVVTR